MVAAPLRAATSRSGLVELYLLRHAIAEDHSATGRDQDRRLTEEGREKLRRVLKRAASANVEPSLIISSPYKRALETAEIAASELHYKGEILRVGSLTPDSSRPRYGLKSASIAMSRRSCWRDMSLYFRPRSHRCSARRARWSTSAKPRWCGSTFTRSAPRRRACCSGC